MTSAGVAGMMFQCVFEGSLSMRDTKIERRLYHKNCSCALHKSRGGACSNACQRNISLPKKQSWSDGSFLVHAGSSFFQILFSSIRHVHVHFHIHRKQRSVNGVQNPALSHGQ